MKMFRYLLLTVFVLGMNILYAEHSHNHQEHGEEMHEHGDHQHQQHEHHHHHDHDHGNNTVDERDTEAVKNYLITKKEEDKDESCSKVAISGDLRVDYSHRNEKANGKHLTGKRKDGIVEAAKNDTDVEFNLRFDYKAGRTWACAQLQFDNAAGIKRFGDKCPSNNCGGFFGSGDCDNICLRKSYIGYNLNCNQCFYVDLEIGRKGNLYNVFSSKVQFVSRFDGLLLKVSSKMKCIDWYLNSAVFLIDELTDHYGYVTETGLYNINNTSIDCKYSFIWWPNHGKNTCGVRNPKGFRYAISQFSTYYHIDPIWSWCKPSYFYGAFLVNHDVYHSNPVDTRCRAKLDGKFPSANLAWYVGFYMGDVVKAGDWTVELRYEWVQAKSIPDGDVSGIGRGITNRGNFTRDLTGNTNYHGWRFETLYGLTDHLSIDLILERSRQLSKKFGGTRSYSKIEVELIYAF